jgi:hypothetical protein
MEFGTVRRQIMMLTRANIGPGAILGARVGSLVGTPWAAP